MKTHFPLCVCLLFNVFYLQATLKMSKTPRGVKTFPLSFMKGGCVLRIWHLLLQGR